jgi:plastocyanin
VPSIAPTVRFPKEAAAETLPYALLVISTLACLAVCFLLAIAPVNPQFRIPSFNFAQPALSSRVAALDPGFFPGLARALFVTGHNALEPLPAPAAPDAPGTLNGKVTYEGTPKKFRPIDMSAEPNCAKFYSSAPMPDVSITGPANSLQNVIVYISAGAPDEHFTGPVVQLDQRGCRYAPHVLTVQAGQEIWVKNDDTVTHSIHPLAHINAEWNRSQPPGTPPVVIRYDQPEFIKVKCELHPWMRGVVAVFKNSHHAITDSTGAFTLADLPPGKYTVTAWHELYGSQTKELVVTPGEKKSLDFVFKVTPY